MAAQKKPKKPNWEKIATEYITSDISQRDLAKKYGIPLRTIQDRCRSEKWVARKKEHRGATVAKALERISDEQARQMADTLNLAAKELLEMALAGIRQLDQPVREHTKIIEESNACTRKTVWLTQDDHGGPVDAKAARNLGGVLRDIRDVLGIKSELERQEQEARIAALRARVPADNDDDDNRHGVVLMPQAVPPKPPEEDSDG